MYQTGGRAKFYTFLYIYVVLILDKQNKLCGKCEKPRRKSNQEPNLPKPLIILCKLLFQDLIATGISYLFVQFQL